ncbi:MAG: hypothetical protein GTO45_04765 [Candidatus Aminicenantes bacterium]|nr:hypothetical protein [Candidatus Aminicenantes bacterium]NIM78065.1 hypothetical protein [Candidatus Aminicenantes bacterium]NIN17382.1 hypothetical protein [Candidatus Aminicenantes bacterium]NIN41275.1 hypothetical protein [Candidatus Aminicenantes bacterium]NIN84048.1 hypothetical protein [Candidatus Aminicenantes bacterium]
MRIKMIAVAPYDGWAFIIKEEQLYLLRPPYQSGDLIEMSEKDLASAISKYMFHECHLGFCNLSETISFLKKKYVEAMEKQGISLPKQEELKSLLRYATDEILWGYLEKAEKEFIPQRNLDAAEAIALALMRIDKVIKNDTMFNKALDIIDRCQEERNKLRDFILDTGVLKHRFPNAEKRYTKKSIIEIMKDTYKRKQLLSV